MGYSLDLLNKLRTDLHSSSVIPAKSWSTMYAMESKTQSYILKTDMSLTENPVTVHPMSYWKRSKPIRPHCRISTLIWQKQMTDVCWSLRPFTLRTNPERLPIFFYQLWYYRTGCSESVPAVLYPDTESRRAIRFPQCDSSDYTQCHRASGYPDRTGYLQYRETGSTDDKRRKNQSGSVFKWCRRFSDHEVRR